MFQTFEAASGATGGGDRVAELRRLLAQLELDAWLVPRADEHQGEYVPPSAERLKWLTGFSGSAGMAVVARKSAALFVDGRYVLQAPSQVDTRLFTIHEAPGAKVSDWIVKTLPRDGVVGFDPWLHTVSEIEQRTADLVAKGITLKPVRRNLVDQVWGEDRPPPPLGPVSVQPLAYAGRSAAEKIAVLQKAMAGEGQDALVLTLPDSIAWLCNIRGTDVAHTPVALCFAIVPRTGKPELFIAAEKISAEVKAHLAAVAKVAPPVRFAERLAKLRRDKAKVRLDPATAAYAVAQALGGAKKIVRGKDPCIDAKAIKSAAEIKGTRAAHERDGVAMVRFLAWLEQAAAEGGLDEIGAVRRLEALRRETGALLDISFDTISGAGRNGAIVHYRVNEATNRKLRGGELFLVDSGGQYRDGTTDITRTIAIGQPTEEMRERYTLVLQGHIAIATARFPKGTRGVELDPLARRPLWARGLDFDHGTGHGVGSYLSVHEGPQSISRRSMVALEPGMIISNEPGYYKPGHYGIRIENLVLVTPPQPIAGGEREMLGFETLTLCPYDRRLIDTALLSASEAVVIDDYHARVLQTLSPHLAPGERGWLAAATLPL